MNRATQGRSKQDQEAVAAVLRDINSELYDMARLTTNTEVQDRLRDARHHVDLGIEELTGKE